MLHVRALRIWNHRLFLDVQLSEQLEEIRGIMIAETDFKGWTQSPGMQQVAAPTLLGKIRNACSLQLNREQTLQTLPRTPDILFLAQGSGRKKKFENRSRVPVSPLWNLVDNFVEKQLGQSISRSWDWWLKVLINYRFSLGRLAHFGENLLLETSPLWQNTICDANWGATWVSHVASQSFLSFYVSWPDQIIRFLILRGVYSVASDLNATFPEWDCAVFLRSNVFLPKS